MARALVCAVIVVVIAGSRGAASRARAELPSVPESALIDRSALPGVDHVLSAKPGSAFVLAAGTAGYGLTESQAGEGAHHRLDATIAAAIRPIEPLAISLAFDGRYDAHPSGDDSAVGLPRLTVVGSKAVAPRLYAGAALALALPGRQAPSLDFSAAVVSVMALGSLRASGGWLLSAQLGYRFDNSAQSAPDVARLSRADRMALGVSELDALLIGASATHALESWQLSAELSGELLLGHAAPSFFQSPLRAAVTARLPVARDLSIELFSRLSLSTRPDYSRLHPLIPVEPRFVLGVGLRFATQPKSEVARAPERTELLGALLDSEGSPVADALVVLRVTSTRELQLAARTDASGAFRFENLPRGDAQLQISGADVEPLEQHIVLSQSEQTIVLRLTPRVHGSQLRGLVRSFEGAALPAQVRLLPDGSSVSADKDGRFVLELAPGSYQVEIECSGYRTQRRKVSVQKNGVTVLNVELRALRR